MYEISSKKGVIFFLMSTAILLKKTQNLSEFFCTSPGFNETFIYTETSYWLTLALPIADTGSSL